MNDRPTQYRHVDVDGDRLFVTTAHIPNAGPGVYFRTDPKGSSVPVDEIEKLIAHLRLIAKAATASWIVKEAAERLDLEGK